jgi:hypothetical protein
LGQLLLREWFREHHGSGETFRQRLASITRHEHERDIPARQRGSHTAHRLAPQIGVKQHCVERTFLDCPKRVLHRTDGPLDLDSHAFQAGHDVERDQRFILDNQKSLALERLGRRGLLNTPQAGGRRLDGIAAPFRDDGGVRRQRRDLALPAISRASRR